MFKRIRKKSIEKKVLHWIKELDKNKVLYNVELYSDTKCSNIYVDINNIFTLVFGKKSGLEIIFVTDYDFILKDMTISHTCLGSINSDFDLILKTIYYIKENKEELNKRFRKYL